MNPKVDAYLRQEKKWPKEVAKLRKILLGCGLTEEFKWNKPCYTFQETNLVVVLPLKEYCALLLCKGALLKDTNGILVKAGQSTQAARQMRFTSLAEIDQKEAVVKAYIQEAIQAEKAGLKVEYKKNPEPVPEELQKALDKSAPLKKAFHALTPGRQRGYILFISAAKQSVTREARVEKYRQQILDGRGMMDR